MIDIRGIVRLFAAAVCIIRVTDSIRLLNISVPHQVGSGHDIQLHCVFILEGHRLYSVKWFKGEMEFFRVVPNESPNRRVFPINGLTIDMGNSNESVVTIRNVKSSNTGKYRCEVSGEAPDFETDYREAHMSVVDLPESGPVIHDAKKSYQTDELVSLNCTSTQSNPPVMLRWFIDGELASERYVKRFIDSSPWSLAFRSKETSVALQFRIGSSISTSSLPMINATCVALIGDIYRSSTSVILRIVDPQPKPTNPAAATTIRPPSHLHASGGGASGSSRCVPSAMPTELIWLFSSLLSAVGSIYTDTHLAFSPCN